MKTKIILFVSLFFSVHAFADDGLNSKVDLHLPTYQTIQKFKKEQLELYILGLREAAKDMEAIHAKEGVTFASAESAWNRFQFFNEAFAATAAAPVMKCSYGGWPRPRNAAGKCTRPPKGKCDGENFECPIIYGSVCVGYGNTARASCAASSPDASVIAAQLIGDTSGSMQTQWKTYTEQIQSYCDGGAFRSHCQALQGRISQIRSVSGVTEFVDQPDTERYPFASGIDPIRAARERDPALNTGAPSATNTTLEGSSTACYSEVLVQSTTCGEAHKNERMMPPEVAFRAFCNEDKEFLESQIAGIRARNRAQMACLQDQAKTKMDKWQRNTNQEQTKMLRGMMSQLERCYQYVKSGKKISSAQLGTLTFNHEAPGDSARGMVMLSGKGLNGKPYTTALQAGYTALSLVLQPNSGRFCDYDLAGYAAPAATTGAPVPPVETGTGRVRTSDQ